MNSVIRSLVGRMGRMSCARTPLLACLLSVGLALSIVGCTNINIRLAMNRGVNLFKAEEYEQAAESFKRAIRMDPTYAEAFLDLGLTYMELYEPGSTHPKDMRYVDGAIESFKRYIRLDPDNMKVRDYLINICSVSGRMQEAIDFFLEDYNEDHPDLRLVKMIAWLYHRGGETNKAIEWFEKAAALDPDNPEAYYSVGVSCWGHSYNTPYLEYEERMAILDKGLEAFTKARELKPDYVAAITYENLIYREKAKYDISPAQSAKWRIKADTLLQKAMQLQNAALAAQAAETGGGQAPSPAAAGGE
ncbi:MAG: tetratricopeptide repeat protein [Acidobacteriota bacterium]